MTAQNQSVFETAIQPPNVLEIPLQSIPTQKTSTRTEFRRAAINTLWNKQITSEEYSTISTRYDPYFKLIYEELCQAACSGVAASSLKNVTNQEILDIVSALRDTTRPMRPPSQIYNTSSDRGKRVVRLAAGLLLPLSFAGQGENFSGAIELALNIPLRDFVEAKFLELLPAESRVSCIPRATCDSCRAIIPASHKVAEPDMDDAETSRFTRHFSAYRLEYIAGFKIGWTHNLLDHLLLKDTEHEVKLLIFHHTKLLDELEALNDSIIPRDLIVETRETLALLLPKDRDTQNWFRAKQRTKNLDPGAIACDRLTKEGYSIDHYRFWRTRLEDLKYAYDNHQPRNPLQVWRDRRQVVQWWTFWIAFVVFIMTVIFGVIQSTTGIKQVLRRAI